MRRYVIDITPVPGRDEYAFSFTVTRPGGGEIFYISAYVVPGLEACKNAIAQDLAEDPL